MSNSQEPSPIHRYEAALANGEIQADKAQKQAVVHLQELYESLLAAPSESSFLKRFLRAETPPAEIRGLYFWGGVGRGKTFLMDTFYNCVPGDNKARMHFHRFMRMVHKELRERQGESDPLKKIDRDFAGRVRLLCFDEFFVSDITDAMLIAGILGELFSNGVVLVATSNVEPDKLYDNGLQRAKFLPAIEMIKQHTRVLNVDGGVDYRLRALELAEIYHYPLDEAADENLAVTFAAVAPEQGLLGQALEIEGRMIQSRACADGVVWFDFLDLCDGPRSQNDYIELARIYQTVLVSNVPGMKSSQDDLARRFISLVDEFYDRNVKLIISAEMPIDSLYSGTRLDFEFQRTHSRLLEMQSHDYLAREHKP